MSDSIDRQMAIAYACSGLVRRMEDGDWRKVADIREDLEKMPSAQPNVHDFPKDADCISRADALSCFHDWIDQRGDVHTADEMPEYQRIEQLPTADTDLSAYSDKLWKAAYERGKTEALPERTGEWKKIAMYNSDHVGIQCQFCHSCYDATVAGELFNFCPNCGAKMEGEDHV